MIPLKLPAAAMFVGATLSGKSFLVRKLLLSAHVMMDPVPEKIVYCYGSYQPMFNEMRREIPNIEFVEGFDPSIIPSLAPKTLLVTDDLMADLADSADFEKLFTKFVHHREISVFHIVQNLFYKGRVSRTIALNCQFFFLFKNLRDQSQIIHLAKQIAPGHVKFVQESYADATKRAHGYLCINLRPDSLEALRFTTNILPDEAPTYVYLKRG